MSDKAPKKDDLQFKLSIESPSLNYAAKSNSRNIVFSVDMPYPLLRSWHDIINSKSSIEDTTTGTGSGTFSYCDLFESSIPCGVFCLTRDKEIRRDIEESLRKRILYVRDTYKRTKGRKRLQLDGQHKRFHVFEEYILSAGNIIEENRLLRDEISEWKKGYTNLEHDLQKLYNEMNEELKKKEVEIQQQKECNQALLTYVKELEMLVDNNKNPYKGKNVSDTVQKARTLKSYLSRAQTALWFSRSFGLEVESMVVRETTTDKEHNLKIPKLGEPSSSNCDGKGYEALSEKEKANVERTLFLMDRFAVGDNFIHELSMSPGSNLPRSYLIKQRRDDLNKMCSISSTPGSADGAQISFNSLLEERVKSFIDSNPTFDTNETIKIKVSGDGAKMTNSSNFVIFSLSLLQKTDDVMSGRGNHTIAIVKGAEKYEALKESFKDVFDDINALNRSKKLTVDGKDYNVELFLGGDYKFILIMLGLKSATSNHSCAWCTVHAHCRHDMNFTLEHYNSPPLKRTLDDMIKLVGKRKDNFCCANEPLLMIGLDHVILDELHLLLRITDVLINNLVEDVLEWDKTVDVNKKKSDATRGAHLQNLIQTVRSCGVSFNIWEKNNADGKGSGSYEFTSLLGNDRKKLLKELPGKLTPEVIHANTSERVANLWTNFRELYKTITCLNPTDESISGFFESAKAWVNQFTSLRDVRKGYARKNVTLYMHAMVYHAPYFLKKYRSLKVFTGQGVERNNDFARTTVLHKSNNWDAPADVLRMEARQWALSSYERNNRRYTKHNTGYWETELHEVRMKKRKALADNSANGELFSV